MKLLTSGLLTLWLSVASAASDPIIPAPPQLAAALTYSSKRQQVGFWSILIATRDYHPRV